MRKKNDIFLKVAFEETFPDLLRFFFPDADSIFNIEKGFQFMDKELLELFPDLEKQGGSRVVDMLAKVYSKNDTEEWILLHCEIQGQDDKDFTRRMFQYFYRIYDRYNVPITALVVFTAPQRKRNQLKFTYEFLGTKVQYEYNSYHILDHSERQLLAMNNPFALVVLAAQKVLLMDKIPERELAEQRLTIARALIAYKKYNNEQIRRFLSFLGAFIYIEDAEINRNFDLEIESLTGTKNIMNIFEAIKLASLEEGIEKGKAEGKMEGKAEGKMEGKAEVVTNLLLTGKFTLAEIANFANVTEEFVTEIKTRTN